MTAAAVRMQPRQLPPNAALYEPRGSALALLKCKADEIMMDGPAGTGKSRGSLEKCNALALKYPGCRGAIVRKKRRSLTETGLVTFEQHVKPGCDTTNQQRNVRQSYKYPNGSEIIVAGVDDPVKLMSAEFDFIFFMEATEGTVRDWEFLTTRLRNGVIPYQQIFGDCNPSFPTHWLKQRMDAGVTTRIGCSHKDNPRLWDAKAQIWTPFGLTYMARLSKLTGPRKDRLLHGLWAAAEGMVFSNWRPDVHLIERRPIPVDWRRIIVIDFGYTHPLVCQWWAISPDGVMYLYREIYRTQRTVRDHARQIKALSVGEYIEAYVTDHDAEDRATLEQELGIKTTAADKAVSAGIQAVQDRLGRDADPGKGEIPVPPRLFIFNDALVEVDPALIDEQTGLAAGPTRTVEEFDGYIWAKGTGGEQLKEKPVKEADDGADALRYAVRYVDGQGRQTFGAVNLNAW